MLKARYLNHLSETSSYDPEEVLAALYNGFESSEDDAQVEYFEEAYDQWNHLWSRGSPDFLYDRYGFHWKLSTMVPGEVVLQKKGNVLP